MKRGLCPGTFDPVTSGHLDIIERASGLLDELVVAVAHSPDKGGGPLFTIDERVRMIAEATQHLPNVSVAPFDSLLVDFAHEVGA
ncbi:pantetheine-phosphate adenylyltransferase, partial [bacterium]|nr:pantetheine-phosphate adenylyltransferase [bacterium]